MEVASFIDNVIVGMEVEKGHDEVVKEVVRKLAENNLYMQQKGFMIEHNIQKREENLANTKEIVAEFERRPNVEVR